MREYKASGRLDKQVGFSVDDKILAVVEGRVRGRPRLGEIPHKLCCNARSTSALHTKYQSASAARDP